MLYELFKSCNDADGITADINKPSDGRWHYKSKQSSEFSFSLDKMQSCHRVLSGAHIYSWA